MPVHLTWLVAGLATAGVMLRPFRIPEAVWAVTGAVVLVLLHAMTPQQALAAAGRGTDVYLFLIGMMVLSELARREGAFDHFAALAVAQSRGSAPRLFLLVYAVGTAVTVFLSNDATAVVLTPAVYAAATRARVDARPYLYTCAFVANAASFVLPISNPANLVVYGDRLPDLFAWMALFAMPSLAGIVSTYAVLRWFARKDLRAAIHADVPPSRLSLTGRWTVAGIAVVTVALLTASAAGLALGMPTAAVGLAVAAIVCTRKREAPWQLLAHVSWSVLPLVAGLFVLVEALHLTGVIAELARQLAAWEALHPSGAAAGAAVAVAVASNLVNNLPAGLMAGSTVAAAQAGPLLQGAVAIGIDLGPNLSVTGSLATLLWLIALRREGQRISGWRFLRIGAVAMPVALGLSLAAYFAMNALRG